MLGLWGSWQSHVVALGATVNVEPRVGFSSTISIFFFFPPWPRKALTWTFNWWGGTVYKRHSGILSRSDLYVSSTYLKTARSCTLASSSFSLLFFFVFHSGNICCFFFFFFNLKSMSPSLSLGCAFWHHSGAVPDFRQRMYSTHCTHANATKGLVDGALYFARPNDG